MMWFRFVCAWARIQYARLMGYEILAPARTVNQRYGECSACPHNKEGICGICKCLIAAKVSLAPESCPRGWWPAVWIAKQYKKTSDK
jgi:hypothetical protein